MTRSSPDREISRWASRAAGLLLVVGVSTHAHPRLFAASVADDYCRIETAGANVELVRPTDDEPTLDDVNWFARPVPNSLGRRIIAFASRNENYLYDLTTGRRVRIPDRSDAVATPDGAYMTVPSHYTATNTINFYDMETLLSRLQEGRSGADVPPVFAHSDADVFDVYYQSVGIVSSQRSSNTQTTVYRMMFSGSRQPAPPGFRIVDYTFKKTGTAVAVEASRPMRLCPQIVNDMATPFISKDGRYVVAHDGEAGKASLKIFEITGLQPSDQMTSCRQVVDFGFVAGKADFSYDNSMLTFHVATYDYLSAFIDSGLRSPIMTDVVVANLTRTADGTISGHGGISRLTTTQREGIGSYFPAFFPDGRLFYVSNEVPKNGAEPKRFRFTVVDPGAQRRSTAFLTRPDQQTLASTIGELWRASCAPALQPFKAHEAAWYFSSLSPASCRKLVEDRWKQTTPSKASLIAACK